MAEHQQPHARAARTEGGGHSGGGSSGGRSSGGGAIGTLEADVGRDRITVEVRLDKIVLRIDSDDGGSGRAELTPDDARELREMLHKAIAAGEETPHRTHD